jgi:Cytochrome c
MFSNTMMNLRTAHWGHEAIGHIAIENMNKTVTRCEGSIVERTHSKDGKTIAESNRCTFCHSGPKFTNREQMDVGTGKPTDRSPLVDVPQLSNVVYSAPYLHDGSARTLEEIWTVFNPKDKHGISNDLTKDELNDLIEYLKTL